MNDAYICITSSFLGPLDIPTAPPAYLPTRFLQMHVVEHTALFPINIDPLLYSLDGSALHTVR